MDQGKPVLNANEAKFKASNQWKSIEAAITAAIDCEQMIRLIFLDIDGVLSTADHGYQINPAKLDLFRQLVDNDYTFIVLSSSWRENSLSETIKLMAEKFNDETLANKIVGVTPRIDNIVSVCNKYLLHVNIPRGVEIDAWLQMFKFKYMMKVGIDYEYVIFDDDTDMLYEHKDRFIKTCEKDGLFEKDIEIAKQILKL